MLIVLIIAFKLFVNDGNVQLMQVDDIQHEAGYYYGYNCKDNKINYAKKRRNFGFVPLNGNIPIRIDLYKRLFSLSGT